MIQLIIFLVVGVFGVGVILYKFLSVTVSIITDYKKFLKLVALVVVVLIDIYVGVPYSLKELSGLSKCLICIFHLYFIFGLIPTYIFKQG